MLRGWLGGGRGGGLWGSGDVGGGAEKAELGCLAKALEEAGYKTWIWK